MTGEVTDRFDGRTLFYLDKSNSLSYKIYNSFSHKVERLFYSLFYLASSCFTGPISDWVECRSLGCRSMRSVAKVVSCCSIGLT